MPTIAQQPDGRDVCIRDLAFDAVGAELDASCWREIAQQAIHQIAALTADNSRLREQLSDLRDELRRLRPTQHREAA